MACRHASSPMSRRGASTTASAAGRTRDRSASAARSTRSRRTATSRTLHAVLEFGCGTGRFAARLLREQLPDGATYLGLDVSPHMAGLARAAVAPWAGRASIQLTDGSVHFPIPDASCDRVVSSYVLDLLSPADAAAFVAEARRVLRPGGLLALASLAPGRTAPARLVTRLWQAIWRLNPASSAAAGHSSSAPCSTAGSGTVVGRLHRHRLVPELGRPGRAPPLSTCRLPPRSTRERRDGCQRVPQAGPRADRLGRRLPRADRRLPRDEPGASGRGGGAAARRAATAAPRGSATSSPTSTASSCRASRTGTTPASCTTSPATATSRRCSPTSSPPDSACRA